MHPIALQFGSLILTWYGVLVAIGFLLGLWTASRRGLGQGLNPERIADLGLWLMLGAIVGARALYVFTRWDEEFAHRPLWEVIAVHRGGLVFYGGLIGAAVFTVAYTRWQGQPLWPVADALAPSISLGQFFGRFGCLMNGCCYGQPTNLPWGIQFPPGRIGYDGPVHPVQLYEAGLNLLLYLALAWQYRRKRFEGQTFALYLIAYGGVRFGVEFFRGDYPSRLGGWATPGQVVSLAVFTAGTALWVWLSRRPRTPVAGGTASRP